MIWRSNNGGRRYGHRRGGNLACKSEPSRFNNGPPFILPVVLSGAGRPRSIKGNLRRPISYTRQAPVFSDCVTQEWAVTVERDITAFFYYVGEFDNSGIRRRQLREPGGVFFRLVRAMYPDLPRYKLQRARAAPAVNASLAFKYAAHVPAPASPLPAPLHPALDGRVSCRRCLPAWRPSQVTGRTLR